MLDVKMPVIETPPLPDPNEEDAPTDKSINSQEGLDTQAGVDTQEEDSVEEEVKDIIPNDEVFTTPQVSKVKKKCSQKQLDHLAKIRKKALLKKQENKAFMEEQKAKQKRFSQIEKQQNRQRKVKQPRPQHREAQEYENPEYQGQEYEYYEEPTAPPQQQPQVGMYQLTQDQIKQLQRDAISEYDTLRSHKIKQRQQVLRRQQEEQAINQSRQQVFAQMSGSSQQQDPWASAFNFN